MKALNWSIEPFDCLKHTHILVVIVEAESSKLNRIILYNDFDYFTFLEAFELWFCYEKIALGEN